MDKHQVCQSSAEDVDQRIARRISCQIQFFDWQSYRADYLGLSQPFFYTEFLNDIRLHFHRYQFACLFVFIVSSELLNGYHDIT